jgi:Rap1a immunity proteins
LKLSPALLLALLGPVIISSATLAQPPIESANEILPGCRAFLAISQGPSAGDELDQMRVGVCAGKISALLNVAPLLEPRLRFCKSEGVTVRQATEVVLQRLEGQPELWHLSFDALALGAFVNAFRCP